MTLRYHLILSMHDLSFLLSCVEQERKQEDPVARRTRRLESRLRSFLLFAKEHHKVRAVHMKCKALPRKQPGLDTKPGLC